MAINSSQEDIILLVTMSRILRLWLSGLNKFVLSVTMAMD